MTQAQHEEEHGEDRPGRSKGHCAAEDTKRDDGTKENRLPAKPEVKIQESGVKHISNMVFCSDVNVKEERHSSRKILLAVSMMVIKVNGRP